MRGIFVMLPIGLMLATATAEAHPHVFVTSSSEIVFAADGSVTGVRHAWTFDDMFSTYALQGVEAKTKGVYTREDLAGLAETNASALKEFDYFTFAKANGKKEAFNEPVDYYMEYKDNQLVLHFLLPFKTPVKTKELSMEIYDPSYFIGFEMKEKEPAKLAGAPAACTFAVRTPKDAQAQQRPLSEDKFMSGDTSNYGAMFANKITVTCP